MPFEACMQLQGQLYPRYADTGIEIHCNHLYLGVLKRIKKVWFQTCLKLFFSYILYGNWRNHLCVVLVIKLLMSHATCLNSTHRWSYKLSCNCLGKMAISLEPKIFKKNNVFLHLSLLWILSTTIYYQVNLTLPFQVSFVVFFFFFFNKSKSVFVISIKVVFVLYFVPINYPYVMSGVFFFFLLWLFYKKSKNNK